MSEQDKDLICEHFEIDAPDGLCTILIALVEILNRQAPLR